RVSSRAFNCSASCRSLSLSCFNSSARELLSPVLSLFSERFRIRRPMVLLRALNYVDYNHGPAILEQCFHWLKVGRTRSAEKSALHPTNPLLFRSPLPSS